MCIRVMVVDDHQILREGLCSLLEKEPDIVVVGEACNGRECISMQKKHSPDIVIMDVTMPDMNGLEATRQLMTHTKKTKVLALSMTTDRRQIQDILRAGAKGFLVKDSAFEELVRAVKVIHGGDRYLSPSIQGMILDEFLHNNTEESEQPAKELLTTREREVLQLIAEGATTKDIADKLSRGIKTIESHRAHIMQKLGARSLAHLTKYAIQEGLTSVDH